MKLITNLRGFKLHALHLAEECCVHVNDRGALKLIKTQRGGGGRCKTCWKWRSQQYGLFSDCLITPDMSMPCTAGLRLALR